MSSNRTPAALSVLTIFTFAWRVMGTGGALWPEPAGGVIANQLVDALVGVVWIMAITIAGYFGVTIATKVAASFEYPAGLGTHPYAWLQVALAVVMGWTVLQRRHARRLES